MSPCPQEGDLRDTRVIAISTIAGIGVVLFAPAGKYVATGMLPGKTTYLTFSRAVQLPGVTLDAGTYIFELLNSPGAPGMVRVASPDRKASYFTGLTSAAERPAGMRDDASVSFGETHAGEAPAITVWWPVGERTGRAFIYRAR
jgi:hypothetical protein